MHPNYLSNAYLVEGSPGSYVELVHFMRDPLFGIWQSLRDTVQTGKSPNAPNAMGEIEVSLARAFHNGVYATMMRVAEILDIEFSAYTKILDLGSHTGAGALCLARRYPQFQATILDRAAFQPVAEEYIRGMKLEERVRFLPGNPEDGQPDGDYDLVLLAHHLSRQRRASIPGFLQNVQQSLLSGGTLLVTEFLLEDSKAEPREAALYRLNVLATYGAGYAGALTRTELYRLLQEAGFANVDMVGLPMFGITAITATKS